MGSIRYISPSNRCNTASSRARAKATTPESAKALDDQCLAAMVTVALIDLRPDVQVTANNGVVVVRTAVSASRETRLAEELEKAAGIIPGVKKVRLDAMPARLDL